MFDCTTKPRLTKAQKSSVAWQLFLWAAHPDLRYLRLSCLRALSPASALLFVRLFLLQQPELAEGDSRLDS